MSTTPTTEQVAFTTPRGYAHVGTVVERDQRVTVASTDRGRILVVEYDGQRFRVPESETLSV